MAEGESGKRVLRIVGAMLGFLVLGAGGCHGECSCPPPPDEAVIHLGCVTVEPPVVKTTGPCTVCPVVLANGSIPQGASCATLPNSQDIVVVAHGAGTCHVELAFGSGATSSVDLEFTSVSIACGSDPCGEGFVAADQSVPDPTCDGGPDAASG